MNGEVAFIPESIVAKWLLKKGWKRYETCGYGHMYSKGNSTTLYRYEQAAERQMDEDVKSL